MPRLAGLKAAWIMLGGWRSETGPSTSPTSIASRAERVPPEQRHSAQPVENIPPHLVVDEQHDRRTLPLGGEVGPVPCLLRRAA